MRGSFPVELAIDQQATIVVQNGPGKGWFRKSGLSAPPDAAGAAFAARAAKLVGVPALV
jgi:hypothetical protein